TPASSGSYRWSIPSNVQTTQCKVKVSDASNLNVFDISDNVFTISSLLLKTPNGAENYAISSMQTVTWTSSNISYVKLEYSINNGIDWSTVATSLPSSGIYYWEIPNTPSAQCLFRISDANNPGTYDLSDNIFAITESPTITMLYPVGNEIFRIGSTETLKWKSNNVTNVKIEYSVNNGSDWKTIALSTPSTGTYSWVVPQENSNLCKIRVSDASRPAIYDMSALPFTITNSPKITVIAPNGSENYPTGSIQSISWSSSNVSKVKIEYSINNGIDWSTVTASYPSSGVYSWTVPSTPSTQCKIRISDTSNVGTYDISDNNFQISEAPSITILYPNGKEKFATGTKETIKWKSNNVNNVKIEYSINNGSDWNLIVSSIASTGTYTWLVPNVSSNLCKVRISDVTKADVFDASDSLFSIANTPKITITAPNGDESYQVGSTQTLKWTSSGISNVKIEYSINNGIDWYLIEASYPSAGIYSWAVPNTPSTQCLIKVTDITNPLNYDISDKVFTIAASPVLQVTAPNGNETWEIGKTQYITWNSVNIVNAKIEYSINNGSDWTVIIASTKSTGSYSWIVPNTPSYQCRVKISDAANPATYDISDSIFTIAASPKIVVTSPNGGESIKAGSLKNITWTSNNVANVKIEYSVNNGVGWSTIAESVPSTGLYRWTVPDTSSLQCRLKISDASNSNVVDLSDNVFTISKIAILTPSSGESLLAGTQYQISWASECINNVKLEYSTDKGTSWTSIVASTSALAGSYQWNIPQTAIKQCMLRISDVLNASVSDISDNYFSVQTLVLLSPAEKAKLTIGSIQPIQWKYYNVTNIKLEYSADGGITWSTIVSSTPAKNGAYNWKVPNNPSEFCLVRVTDLSNTQNTDITKSYFAITNVDAVERVDNSVPTDYALLQNHPNPFNPTTMIRFRIPVSAFVVLKVYDLMGKEVCTLVNEEKSAGTYDVNFNASSLANGIYLYKIQAGSYVATKKLLLLK
ncbi:MAG: T9SS type A sorting domain-containing protein, partial [Bacteroidota bacterium]|nr:T9SS type A sorting domain-containing protein [Bacteroidota bacterium]